MKLRNKLLIIFLFIATIFLFFSNKTFATVDKEIIYDDYVYNLEFNNHEAFNGNNDYFIVGWTYEDTNEVLFTICYWDKSYTSTLKFYNDYENNTNIHYCIDYESGGVINYTFTNRVQIGSADVISFKETKTEIKYLSSLTYDTETFLSEKLVGSSCDLFYYEDRNQNIEDSTLVFQPTWVGQVGFLPIRAIFPTQVIKNTRETLATIIPIVMVAFSALLSPFLIKYLKSHIS